VTSVGVRTLLLISMKKSFLQLGFLAFRSEVLVQFSNGSWFLVVQTLLATTSIGSLILLIPIRFPTSLIPTSFPAVSF
jgi:hypothetical protein